MWKYISGVPKVVEEKKKEKTRKLPVIQQGGVNFWASENLSGRVHFEGNYSPEWWVLSKLSVQPCDWVI